jgi:hypothetical protein
VYTKVVRKCDSFYKTAVHTAWFRTLCKIGTICLVFYVMLLCCLKLVTKVSEELIASSFMVDDMYVDISLQQFQDSTPPFHVFFHPFLYKNIENFFTC